MIRLVYQYALPAEGQTTFEQLALMFNHYTHYIPLTFLLGFYVASVVARWWQQFQVSKARPMTKVPPRVDQSSLVVWG